MKNLFTAVILGIVLTGVALAQTAATGKTGRLAGKGDEIKIAVVEFTPGANASEMTPDAKRQLQTHLAAALAKSDKYDVADVRHTQRASKDNLADINNSSSTTAAVKLGKLLGVSYVLTGTVEEYTPKDAEGFSQVALKTRLIEVATGKVKHTGEATQRSESEMRTTGVVEVQTKAVKPAILKLAATILELKF